jgi:hypothetical protein
MEPERAQRRRVRLFVALHLGAVGLIYAVALVLGGGFAGPTMPPVASTLAQASIKLPVGVAPEGSAVMERSANPPVPTELPDWTQRADIPPPWGSR